MSKKIIKIILSLILYAFASNIVKISAMEIRPEISTKDAPTKLDENKFNKYKKKMKSCIEKISKNCKPEYGNNYIKNVFEECKNFIEKPIEILKDNELKINTEELLKQLEFFKIEINDKKEGLIYENDIKQRLIDYLKHLKNFLKEKEEELKPYLSIDINNLEQIEITKEILSPLKEKIKTINKENKKLNLKNKKDIKIFKEHAIYINQLLNSNYYDDENNTLSSQQIDFKELINKLKELNTIENNNYENYYIKKEIKENLENLLKESKKNIVKLKNDNKIDLNLSNRIEIPKEAIKKYINLIRFHKNLVATGVELKSPSMILFHKKLENLICLNNFSLDMNKLLENLLKYQMIKTKTNINYFIDASTKKDLEQTFNEGKIFIKQITEKYKIKEKKIPTENINTYINDLKTKVKELENIDKNSPNAKKMKHDIISEINEKLHTDIEDDKISYETAIIKEIQKLIKEKNDEKFFYYIDEKDKKNLKTEITNIKNAIKTFNRKDNQKFFQEFSKQMVETLINKLKELEKKVEEIVPDKNIENSKQKDIALKYLNEIFQLLSLNHFEIDYSLLTKNLNEMLGYEIKPDYFLISPLDKNLENKLKKEIYTAKAFFCEYANLYFGLFYAEKNKKKYKIKEIIANQINITDKYTSLFLKDLIIYNENPNDETLYNLEKAVEKVIENTYLTFEQNINEKRIDKISLFSTVYDILKYENKEIYYEEFKDVLTGEFKKQIKSIYKYLYEILINRILKLYKTDKYAASTLENVKKQVEIIHEEEVKKAKKINEMKKYSVKYKNSKKEKDNKEDDKNKIKKIKEEIDENVNNRFKKYNNMYNMYNDYKNKSYLKNFDKFIKILDFFCDEHDIDKESSKESLEESNEKSFVESSEFTNEIHTLNHDNSISSINILDEEKKDDNKNKIDLNENKITNFEDNNSKKDKNNKNKSNKENFNTQINYNNILDEEKKDDKNKINIKDEDELIDAAPIISVEKDKYLENSINIINKKNEYDDEEIAKENEAPLPINNLIEKPNPNQINNDFNILLDKMNPSNMSKENYEKLKKFMKTYEQNQSNQNSEKQKNKKQKHKKNKK